MEAKPAFVDINKIKRIHLMGIGGAGMSGLAKLLMEMGKEVSGCDAVHTCYVDKISKQGISFSKGHHREHLDLFAPELLIFTSAISETHPEIQAAHAKGIPVAKRAEVLSEIFNSRSGVGVAGTHGKTTTSSMISVIAEQANCGATVVIGGEISDIGCNAKLGLGEHIVAELDESDGSFELFTPQITVITNIDWDHIDHYASFHDVSSAFERFVRNRKQNSPLIVCAEDAGVQCLLQSDLINQALTYGWGTGWDWGATDLQYIPGGGMKYLLNHKGVPLGEIELAVSGEHNVLNSLAACAAAQYMGISIQHCRQALSTFTGAKRRLQCVGNKGNIDIYDDYAHHPREIAATLQALSGIYPERRKLVVFQPHRYTRTQALYKEFALELSKADQVYLLPIFSSDEAPIEGISSEIILNEIVAVGGSGCALCNTFETAVEFLKDSLVDGDLVLTMGAGSVGELGIKILEEISKK